MTHIPAEHVVTANDRHLAELELETQGWTLVKLPRTQPTRINMKFVDMMKWCEDHVGTGRVEIEPGKIDADDMWYSFSWYGYWNFWFRRETDATAFALRWS